MAPYMQDLLRSPRSLEIKRTLEDMCDFLSHHEPDIPAPPALMKDLDHSIETLINEARLNGDVRSSDTLERLHYKLARTKSNSGILRIINILLSGEIDDFSTPNNGVRLEKKIARLENEIIQLSSNPEFETKMSKLEEELNSIRMLKQDLIKSAPNATLETKLLDLEKKMQAFLISTEVEEKKFDDMLKAYINSERKVFIIMPFASDFDDVWRGGIARACNASHIGCLRVDEIRLSTWINEDIKDYIEKADVVIADITGSNPNVMFELGWALAKGKEPIVIRRQDDPIKIPFDVHGIRHIAYLNTWSGIERLHREICKYIKATEEAIVEKGQKKADTKTKTN